MNANLKLVAILLIFTGCAREKDFPLREPLWMDSDLASVRARCHHEPTARDPNHIACAPRVADSRLYWDGMDNLLFRPISEAFGVVVSGEAVDVNSMDEVPDSAWFINRIGERPMTVEEVASGACTSNDLLDPDGATEGSWIIDRGKAEGATEGFRVSVPGKGKFMLKAESIYDQPERQGAAAAIGAAVLHAVGYYATCEQVIYLDPAILKLTPGLRAKPNFGDEKVFDRAALDAIIVKSPRHGAKIRMSASKWIEGHVIGPYDFHGTRDDDPNDVINHEDRRELRGMRVVSAWLGRYDTRRGNTLDTWIADDKTKPDSSPGHVLHYQLDTSEAIGGNWPWDPLSRRLGNEYVFDWGDMGADFITLGIPTRPWDTKREVSGEALFGYFTDVDFRPDDWRNAYPNKAYSRATARDKAWMARILARFTPQMVDTLARLGNFTDDDHTAYLSRVLRGRLDRILERYLTTVSPIADVRIAGDTLCGTDLADWRHLRTPATFHYSAAYVGGPQITMTRSSDARVCATLLHTKRPYGRIAITDGVAKGKLTVHVVDRGPNGFQIVGLER